MLSIHKILVPIVFTNESPDNGWHIAQQAAWLARRFHAEITLLHVVTPLNYPAGLLESRHEVTARELPARCRRISRWDQALPGKVPQEFQDRLGIAIAKRTVPELVSPESLRSEEPPLQHDSSTNALIQHYRSLKAATKGNA